MRSGPVTRAMRGGLTRRRVQTIVIGLVVLISTGASVLALALVVDSSAPFDHAFAAQHGADVVATIDAGKVTDAQLAATGHLAGVTAAAGPFTDVTVTPTVDGQAGNCNSPGPCFGPGPLGPTTLTGRASTGGPVDDLTLQSGHWASQPGQVVMDSSGQGPQVGMPLGTKLTITDAPGKPTLTVVGTASSVTGTSDGWVTPSEIAALSSASNPASAQMLYRFASAASSADLQADMATVTKALPAGSVTGTESYLAARAQESGNIGPFVPFLFAFGVIGMVMSVLIVANVVSGAVVSGYRRIGILKSIGFTPAQVLGSYAGQVIIPAFVGCVIGVVIGNMIAAPVLAQTAQAYGVGALGVPVWVDVLVPAVMLCLVGVAAVLPALRAARLSAIRAIATGRAPQTGRGYAAHRLLGRLRLPRPATIGLAAPFAKPARTAVTLVAVLLGAATVTLAVGLSTSLRMVVTALSHDQAQQVQVVIAGGPLGPGGSRIARVKGPDGGPGVPAQPSAAQAQRAITAALTGESGTLRYVGEADQLISVAGQTQQFTLTGYTGSSSWTGWAIVSGHWFTGPNQVEVSAQFLTLTGDSVGDNIAMENGGRQVTAKIVGEIFSGNAQLITDWQTLAALYPGITPNQYDIGLRPGTSEFSYIQGLSSKLGPDYAVLPNQRNSTVVDLMIGLIGTLTLLLAVVAGLGVLNTVVLYSRERVHDLGVFKAVGMTPRQTIAMVVCWVAGTGLIAGLIAVPVGILLHRIVLPAMANAADVGVPPSFLNVYGNGEIAVLALAGLAIAIAGALLPAGWAAGTKTATALRAE